MAALFTISVLVVNSTLRQARPDLVGLAVLADLTLTAACVHWVLGVRGGGLPAWTLLPVVATGWSVASFFVPAATDGRIGLLIAAALEASVLTLVIVRVRRLSRGYRAARAAGADRWDSSEAALLAVMPFAPRLAAWGRAEGGTWAFATTGWFRRGVASDSAFSHHRDVGWAAIAGALVHWWLNSKGWMVATWAGTGVHLYGIAWVIGDAHALRLRPTTLDRERAVLDLRIGLRLRLRCPLATVASIELGEWDKKAVEGEVYARVLGAANLRLELNEPVTVQGLFRRVKEARVILVQVDDPARLRKSLLEAGHLEARAPAG